MLRHSLDWIADQSRYTNTALEQDMTYLWNLKALLHTPPKRLPLTLKHNIIVRDTVVAWQAVRRRVGLSVSMSRYSPILQNPDFPQGNTSKASAQWQKKV